MPLKEKIIENLKNSERMTLTELSNKIYGDNKHLSNIYSSLLPLVKNGILIKIGDYPANYQLNLDSTKTLNKEHQKNKIKVSVPKPTNNEVDYWLKEWDSLPDYTVQEEAINELFQGYYNSNKSLKNIIIKCSVLNDFYSTNIFKVYPVACHILDLDIDERLKKGDISLVNEIANNKIANKEKNFYSFASKYCSHHNQDEYPIYDSYVDQMLRHFRKIDRFFCFDNKDLKDYKKFKNILLEFRKFYKLHKYTLKELDMYLWQVGKKYFPKKYYKK